MSPMATPSLRLVTGEPGTPRDDLVKWTPAQSLGESGYSGRGVAWKGAGTARTEGDAQQQAVGGATVAVVAGRNWADLVARSCVSATHAASASLAALHRQCRAVE